jgi:hypothetical protein
MSELPERRDFGDYAQWPGRDVLDAGGDRLGTVREIYLDDATDLPEWVLVELEEDDARFVPLADATVQEQSIRVAHAAAAVRAAPSVGTGKELSQDHERELYAHYEVPVSEDDSESVLPVLEGTPEPAEPEPAAAAPEPEPAAAAPEPEPVAVPEPITEPEPEPAPEPVAELPSPGETAEPELEGPPEPPRPEPVAPAPPPRPASPPPPPPPHHHVPEPDAGSSGPPVPAIAGAAVLALLILLILRSRRD